FAVLLVEPRGCGGSAAVEWPRPESWTGREERLARLTAADLHAALVVLAREAHADTARVALGGVQNGAALAIRAAARVPGVAALRRVCPRAGPGPVAPRRGPRPAGGRRGVGAGRAPPLHALLFARQDLLLVGARELRREPALRDHGGHHRRADHHGEQHRELH